MFFKKPIIVFLITTFVLYPCAGYARDTQAAEEPVPVQTDLPAESAEVPTEVIEAPPEPDSINSGSDAATVGTQASINSSAIQVDPQTGSASTSVSIDVVQGRAGIQPSISLVYNSSLRNGPLGQGWMMDLGSITLSTKKGAPVQDDYAPDTWVFQQNGSSQDLIFDAETGFFYTDSDGGFMKFKYRKPTAYSWEVTGTSGEKYYFGETREAKEYDEFNSHWPSRFCLTKVEDVNGNYMTIAYMKDAGKSYPQVIEYTGNSAEGLAPFAKVEFIYEDRPDTSFSYMSRFRIETNKRLAAIHIYADDVLQRKYELHYKESEFIRRSLLESVKQYGADGVSDDIPTATFSYYDSQINEFKETSILRIPTEYGFTDQKDNSNGVALVDVNADALPDIVYANGNDRSTYRTLLNNGTGFYSTNNWVIPRNEVQGLRDGNIRFADVNGDGMADILWAHGPDAGMHVTYLNDTAASFVRTSSWIVPIENSFVEDDLERSNGIQLVDVNGDGLTDIFWADEGLGSQHKSFLNNGSQFIFDLQRWRVPGEMSLTESKKNNNDDGSRDNGVRLADINGDGLIDLLKADGDDNEFQTYLNTGRYFRSDPGWRLDKLGVNGTDVLTFTDPGNGDYDNGVRLVDLNGDGLTDLFSKNDDANRVYLNDGSKFVLVTQDEKRNWWIENSMSFHEPGDVRYSNGVQFVDMNGDGLVDVVWADERISAEHKTFLNTGEFRYLLKKIDNGLGGTTEITYVPSTRFQNTFLPFPIPVVKTVTLSNSLGEEYPTTYEYADGLWSGEKREFRGFGTVKVIDTNGNYSITKYLQDDILHGRPERQESYDSEGRLYTRTVNAWASRELRPDSHFVYLERTDNYIYDGDADGRRTAEEYFYEGLPEYAQPTRVVQLGEVDLETGEDIGNDSRTVETEYVNNAAKNIFGLPVMVQVKNDAGEVVRKTWFEYDNNETDENLKRGLLTRKEDWAGDEAGAVNPVTRYSYDAVGNLVTTTDPRGFTTVITYDPDFYLFPLRTENAMHHHVENEYYGINGVLLDSGDGYTGLWGQLKSTTDPNEQQGHRVYDTYGRAVKSISPLDSLEYPTSETTYQFLSKSLRVKSYTRLEHGRPETLVSAAFYDGLGRMLLSKTPSSKEGQYVVSGLTQYNQNGQPEHQYIPFFAETNLDFLDYPIDESQPRTFIKYDAIGRASENINPDGSRTNRMYDDWTNITIDANGHRQESDFDAYGRLVEKREYTGADGRAAPFYPQTPYEVYSVTRYVYDSEGNLTRTIDDQGNTTVIDYDQLGRKIRMDDPDMGVWQYEYDLNGNLIKQTDAKGQVLVFTYDELNRLTNKTDGGSIDVSYTYDQENMNFSKGRLNQAAYTNGDAQFDYDALGRETSSLKTIGNAQYPVAREYDALNNLEKLEYPDNVRVHYKYNRAGQIAAVVSDESLIPPDEDPDPGNDPDAGIPMAAPVFHYKLNDNAADRVVRDAGAGGYTGTATADTSVLSKSGRLDRAFLFKSADSNCVEINPLINQIKNDTQGSFAFWFYSTQGTLPQNVIVFSQSGSTYFSITVDFTYRNQNGDGAVVLRTAREDESGIRYLLKLYTDKGLREGGWYHVVVTQDGQQARIFINGTEMVTDVLGEGVITSWLQTVPGISEGRLGCAYPSPSADFLDAYVDDLRYYHHALTQGEINALYNNGVGTEDFQPKVKP